MSTTPAALAAPEPQVLNATPFTLTLSYFYQDARGSNAGSVRLPPLETLRAPWLPTARVSVAPSDYEAGRWIDGALPFGPSTTEVAVTTRSFRSFGDGRESLAVLINNTRFYVDIAWINSVGEEHVFYHGLAPGWRVTLHSLEGYFWVARTSFTGELLGMLLVGERTQSLTVTEDFLKVAQDRLPPPSPLPEVKAVTLVGAQRQEVNPASRDYLLVASQDNLRKERFNAREKVPTRTVKISGVKVVWDELLDKVNGYGLMPYQGKGVLDLEALEIYADHVVIASPLHFPGTNVTIHARELEFQRDGQICTTPLAYTSPAESPYKTAKGQPANEKLEPTYRAEDGRHGESGGAIHLFLRKLTLPEGAPGRPRFVTSGSPGQKGEPGGHKEYAPNGTDRPDAKAGKSLAAITLKTVEDTFKNYFKAARQLSDWRWPGEVASITRVRWNDKLLLYEGGSNVVNLEIVACDDTFTQDTNFLFLPSGYIRKHLGVLSPGYELAYAVPEAPARLRPGDGEDAYPGGRPGNGGPGGSIHSLLPLEPALCDTRGGPAGATTEAVAASAPGGPTPAYWVKIHIDRQAPHPLIKRQPSLFVLDVTAQPGQPAGAVSAQNGPPGVVNVIPGAWMHPDALDAVVACAKDAYRNGHRDLARTLLDPYYAELRALNPLPDDLQGGFVAIEAMRANLRNNVDYYGHRPGWVPRLRLSSNYELFQRIRSISCELLYYALNMEEKYDTLDNANRLAEEASDAIAKELDETVNGLKEAYTALAEARLALLEVEGNVKLKQVQISNLKTWAAEAAVDAVRRQRIYRGVMKTIGGLMKAIPVGQPYLGAGGDVVSAAGEFNWTNPDAIPDQIRGTFQKVGDATDSFLEKNKDLLIKDRVRPLRDRLKLDQEQKDALEKLVPETRGAIKVQESAVASAQADVESLAVRTRKRHLQALQGTLGELEQEIKDEAAINALRKEFADDPDGQRLFGRRKEVRQKMRELELRIERERANDRKNPPRVDPKRAQRLKEAQDSLEKTQAELESQEKNLQAATTATEAGAKALAAKEEKLKDTLGRLKGMGAGVSAFGAGVASLASLATLKKDDEDVQQVAALILESDKKEELQSLLKEFEGLAKKQQAALAALLQAQQLIATGVANVAQNLGELNGLSRQRQSVRRALDLRTRRYLKAMQTRARDGLRWSTYNLVMAYRYENLRDVPESFYNFDKVVEELRKLECTTADGRGGKAWQLDPAKFRAAEDRVVRNEFFGMALDLLNDRQTVARRKKKDFVCQLAPGQLDVLRRTGRLVFNLVRDLQKGSFNATDARLFDIGGVEIDLETRDPQLSLDVTFRHSGESILLGHDRRYYYFRADPSDDPIAWGFTYNHLVQDKNKRVTKDEVLPEEDELLNQFLEEKGKPKVTFREYLPAWFSDLTLTLTGGPWDPGAVEKITRFQFTASCAVRD